MPIEHSTDRFRSKVYEPVFQNTLDFISGNNEYKEVVISGGGASGKSFYLSELLIFFITEIDKGEILVITANYGHHNNTINRFTKILTNLKYKYTIKDNKLFFGNNNVIHFIYTKSSSHDEITEKLKTWNSFHGNVQFIWSEEHTSVINTYGTFERYQFTITRLFRELAENSIKFYTYNALPIEGQKATPNSRHPINKWEQYQKNNNALFLKTTIYDLPKKWQSQEDLKQAEFLKKFDYDLYDNVYLGNDATKSGGIYKILPKVYDSQNIKVFDYIYGGIDEGRVDAVSYVVLGVIGNDYYIIDQFYVKRKNMVYVEIYNEWRDFLDDFNQRYNNQPIEIKCETSPGFFYNTAYNDSNLPENIVIEPVSKRKIISEGEVNKKSYDDLSVVEQRILATNILLSLGLLHIANDKLPIYTAFEEAIRDNRGKRRDDGYSDIDSLDSFEYSLMDDLYFILYELVPLLGV